MNLSKIVGMILVTSSCFGNSLTVDELRVKENKLPYFKSQTSPHVAENINTFVYFDLLNNEDATQKIPKNREETLKSITKATKEGHLTLNSYHVTQTAQRLDIHLGAEGCGAYCESFEKNYHFLTATGQSFTAGDMFDPKGKQKVESMIRTRISTKIKNFLAKITKAKDETALEQKEMYQGCLANAAYWGMNNFSLDAKGITFTNERCSNHAAQAIDNLGEFTERFTLQELTASMNNFGKALIADHPTPPLLEPVGIFRGTLGGKYPITVFIQTINDDGSLTGFYWYDKQQKPLTLGGTYHNALMSLQADKETFTLTYTNNTLNGAWQQGKNTPLEVKLTQ
jgi:hypothetical protein